MKSSVATYTHVGIAASFVGNVYNYPFDGEFDADDDLWVNIETSPKGAAISSRVVYSVNGGQDWLSAELELDGEQAGDDWWHVNLGAFSADTTIRYAVEVTDGVGSIHWANNDGNDYYAHVNAMLHLAWAGNTYNWPAGDDLDSSDNLWINAESYPVGAGRTAYVAYTSNGVDWYELPMTHAGQTGVNDHWHVNLGQFDSNVLVELCHPRCRWVR